MNFPELLPLQQCYGEAVSGGLCRRGIGVLNSEAEYYQRPNRFPP